MALNGASTAASRERLATPSANTNSRDRRRSSSTHPSGFRASLQQQLLTWRTCTVWIHEPPNFATRDVVINPEVIASLGGVSDSTELLEIRLSDEGDEDEAGVYPGNQESMPPRRRSRKRNNAGVNADALVFRAIPAIADPDLVQRQPQLQLSVSRGIALQHGFHNRGEVVLSKVPRAPHTIDHVELYFRDQYVGRADMWRLTMLLEDTCVHFGQKIALAGSVRATVGRIFIKEQKVTSGYVSSSTKAIFRSESAKYNLFLQLSREMWQFDEDGELYYEKAISGFIPELLKRWRSVPTNHIVSVIIFARVHYDESELHMLEDSGGGSMPLRREADGLRRWYVDYYKVVVDLESNCDWAAILTVLKEEFFRFQHDILLTRRPVSGPVASDEEQHADLLRDRALLAGRLSYSHEGNILEAVNLALNPFEEHYIDRDLNRTGLSIVFVTAGTGRFDVDKRLLRITTERMIDNGLGLDLVCLTKMPLHSVPLFHFTSHLPTSQDEAKMGASSSVPMSAHSNNRRNRRSGRMHSARGSIPSASYSGSASTPVDPLYCDPDISSNHAEPERLADFYSMPHWIDCSYYNLQQDKPFRADQFVPRCKMYEVQMMGVMENEISDIVIPYLDSQLYPPNSRAQPPKPSNASLLSSPRTRRDGSRVGDAYLGARASSSQGPSSVPAENALAALEAREQRRLARERFDADTMRDLETSAPRAMMPPPSHAHTGGGSSFGTPQPSSPTHGGSSLPHARSQANIGSYSRDAGLGKDASPTKSGKPQSWRSSNRRRELSSRSSPVLQSHPEDPGASSTADAEEGPRSPPRMSRGTPWRPTSMHVSTPTSTAPASPQMPTGSEVSRLTEETRPTSMWSGSRPTSRPGSIFSVSTAARASLRPLEPLGKAPALVAPSDPELSAVTDEYLSSLQSPQPTPSQPPSPAHAVAQLTLAGSKGGSIGRKKSQGYRWLWSSLTGSRADEPSSSDAAAEKAALDTSITASRRIQELLGAHLAPPGPTNEGGKRASGRKSLTGSPIRIPSQLSIASDVSKENDVDTVVRREQDAYEQRLEEDEARQRYAQRVQVEKQTLVNPSNPSKNLASTSSQLLRWQHLFPRRLNRHAVKWRSMTSPACLPLTTLYLPTEADLTLHWQEYPHTLSVSSEMTSFLVKRATSTPPALAMLREMASQRLAQGFQFIVPAYGSLSTGGPSSRSLIHPGQFALRYPSELFQPGTLSAGTPILLGMSNQIHRISYDRNASAIDVKRFVRKTNYALEPIEYSCCVWPRHLPGYQAVSAQFKYPDSGSYAWTYLDSLIAGYAEEELVDGLRYWRTRFVLVPAAGRPPPMTATTGELLSDEEIRLAGTDRLAELFARARWVRPSPNASDRPTRTPPYAVFRFVPTSLDPSASMGDPTFLAHVTSALAESVEADAERERAISGSGASSSRQKLLRDQTLEAIAKDMRSEKRGVKISDRLWHRIMYADTFTGGDFVSWLCREYADVRNREEAVEWGIKFQREGLFQHVHDTHGFLDGHYFYQLRSPYAAPRSGKGWFRGIRTHDETADRDGASGPKGSSARVPSAGASRRVLSGGSGPSEQAAPAASASQQSGMSRKNGTGSKVQMSRSIIIDVDPGRKSDRAEVAFLHHDISHNPANGFNFQIHWLGTTARFVEDIVQVWTRTVEKYGLRLIEAPIGQIKDVSSHNPFQAPLQIELALEPPPPSAYVGRLPERTRAEGYFETCLLRKFGFVLDQEAASHYPSDNDIVYSSRPNHFEYSQYVHRSGVAFVQVLGGLDGFLWLNNRLFNSHATPANSRGADRPDRLGPGRAAAGGAGGPSSGAASAPPAAASGSPDVERVRRDFIAFCSDPSALEAFYKEVSVALVKDSAPKAGVAAVGQDAVAALRDGYGAESNGIENGMGRE